MFLVSSPKNNVARTAPPDSKMPANPYKCSFYEDIEDGSFFMTGHFLPHINLFCVKFS